MDLRSLDRGQRGLVLLAALVIVVAGLKFAAPLLLPFLFAAFLAVLAAPSVLWLERRGIPPAVAVVPTLVVLLGLLAIFGAMLTASIDGFVEAAPGYSRGLARTAGDSMALLASFGVPITLPAIGDVVGPADMIDVVGTLANAMVSALSNTALVLLTLLFMLLEVAGLPRKLVLALGASQIDLAAAAGVMVEVQRYLAIKTAVSVLTGALVAMLCAIVGVDFPLVWGLIAFLLNFIPNIGSVIAAVPTTLVTLVQPEMGPGPALVVLIGYVVINTLVGNMLEPAWMGRKLGMSTLVVFLSLVFWGWVWGPIGMFLSVPLTMVVKILLERSESLQPIAVLLGPAPAPP